MGYDISLRVRQDELAERFKASGYSKVTDADVDYICLAETGEVIYTCEDGIMISK